MGLKPLFRVNDSQQVRVKAYRTQLMRFAFVLREMPEGKRGFAKKNFRGMDLADQLCQASWSGGEVSGYDARRELSGRRSLEHMQSENLRRPASLCHLPGVVPTIAPKVRLKAA
jgi:hypothetical protein